MHATEKKKDEKTGKERIQKYCSSKTAYRNGRILEISSVCNRFFVFLVL